MQIRMDCPRCNTKDFSDFRDRIIAGLRLLTLYFHLLHIPELYFNDRFNRYFNHLLLIVSLVNSDMRVRKPASLPGKTGFCTGIFSITLLMRSDSVSQSQGQHTLSGSPIIEVHIARGTQYG